MSICPLTLDTYRLYGGRIADNTLQVHAQEAMKIVWAQVEHRLSSSLLVISGSYTSLWPIDGVLPLPHLYLKTLLGVTARHDDGKCECTLTDYAENAFVLNYDLSILKLRACNGTLFGCAGGCGTGTGSGVTLLAAVQYTYGLFPTFDDVPGEILAPMIGLARKYAREFSGDEEEGSPPVQSYSDLGYSESRGQVKETPFGFGYPEMRLESALRPYVKKRAIRASVPKGVQ